MKKSELITNPDASIYHLKLKNGEVASRIITVGDPSRVEAVTRHFDTVNLTRRSREFTTVTGRIGPTDLTVVSTGIGTDNIDVVLNELQLVNSVNLETREPLKDSPTLEVVRLGTSGAIQEEVPLNSLLISESALGFDGLLGFYENNFERPNLGLEALPHPFWVKASSALLEQFQNVTPYRGITVTASGFYAPQGRSLLARAQYPNLMERLSAVRLGSQRLTNLEMETAGIYGLGELLGMRTLSISAILANRLTGTFSSHPQKAIDQMIEKALACFIAPR